mgnify:CR=1 FL=1
MRIAFLAAAVALLLSGSSTLAADIAAHPPAESGDPAWQSLLASMVDSVTALSTAAHGGDPAAAKAALGHIKAPYSKLFLKFG